MAWYNLLFNKIFLCSLCIKHPNLFGKSEKLDVLWDKGLYDSNVLIAYRKPRPEWLSQQSLIVQVCSMLLSAFWKIQMVEII